MADEYFQPDVIGYLNLTTKAFTLATTGGPFKWPDQIQGDTLNVGLRFLKEIDGRKVLVERDVAGIKASVGYIDQRPTGGDFQIQVGPAADPQVEGSNLTAALPYNFTAQQLEDALNALGIVGPVGSSSSSSSDSSTFGAATVFEDDESFVIEFAGELLEVDLTIRTNTLTPISFVRIRGYENDGVWYHAIRLLRAPLAFTSTSVLAVPPPPRIEAVIDGSTDETTIVNEVQNLVVPPEFRGSYRIRRGLKKSTLLSRADGPAQIFAAINPADVDDLRLGDDEDAELRVSRPRFGVARIEFAGSMEGTNYDPMTIEVVDAPTGDLSFSLSLDRALVLEALRGSDELTVPFEIQILFDDLNVEDEQSRLTYRTDVLLKRELIWSELSEIDDTDWSRPTVKTDYIPSDGSEVEVGFANFPFLAGVSTTITVDHDLDSDFIEVLLLTNDAALTRLVEGTDYTLDRTVGPNSVEITLIGAYDPAPGANALKGMVFALEEESRFSVHNQAIETITGGTGDLRSILDEISARLAALEADGGGGGVPSRALPDSPTIAFPLLPKLDLFPTRRPFPIPEDLSQIDLSTLPRVGGLLPAVHDAATETLPLPVPDAASAYEGRVFEWDGNTDSAGVVDLLKLQTGDFVACNGSRWYRVEQFTSPPAVESSSSGSGSSASSASSSSVPENSFYPAELTRELFTFAVNEKQFRRRKTLEFQAGLELRVLRDPSKRSPRTRDSEVYCALVVELGDLPEDTVPDPTGKNLKNVVWRPVPAFECPLTLTPTPISYHFGIRATRDSSDVFTLKSIVFGDLEAGATDAIPDSFNFAIRARLIRFDTENGVTDPRGFVALSGFTRTGPGENASSSLGLVTID